ncbi:hypothetical protein ACQKFK_32495 [Bacillus mycoides]
MKKILVIALLLAFFSSTSVERMIDMSPKELGHIFYYHDPGGAGS